MRWLFALWLAWSGIASAASPDGRPGFVSSPAAPVADALLPPPALPAGWVSERGAYADVHGDPRDRATLLRLSRHASAAVPRLAAELGVPAVVGLQVYLAPDARSFEELQPGAPPDWADGTAWPHRGLVFLRAPRLRDGTAPALEVVLDHELVHVLLGQAFGARPVPRWLQEGVAKVMAREYTPGMTDALAAGMLGDDLIPLERLVAGFPEDPVRAQLAYAQSADLVAWLRNRWGDEALRVLIGRMAAGEGFGPALHAATGMSVDQLEEAWLGRLHSSPLWLRPLASDGFILGVGALFFVVGGTLALRRRRQRLAEMQAEEDARDAAAARAARLFAGAWDAEVDEAPLSPEVRALLQARVDHPWVH
jgi:hypothetical protein